MKQHYLNNNDGYIVLITILILGVAATTIAVFLLVTGTDASIASAAVEAGVEARAGASACAELALGAIQSNTTIATPSNGSENIDSTTQETCNYQITGSSPNYTIVASGVVEPSSTNYVHNLTITLNQVTPQLTVSSWQESP